MYKTTKTKKKRKAEMCAKLWKTRSSRITSFQTKLDEIDTLLERQVYNTSSDVLAVYGPFQCCTVETIE